MYRHQYDKTTKSCDHLLLQENARSHTANQIKNWSSSLNFDVPRHPVYSPDKTLNALHLLQFLQKIPTEILFKDTEEAKSCLSRSLASKTVIFYYSVINKLELRCNETR